MSEPGPGRVTRHLASCAQDHDLSTGCPLPVPVPIAPDAARDARVAARRAADARKAGAALDRLLAGRAWGRVILPQAYDLGWQDGYATALRDAELQHNRHSDVFIQQDAMERAIAAGVDPVDAMADFRSRFCTCDEPTGLSGCDVHRPLPEPSGWRCRVHNRPHGDCAGNNTDGMPCAAS